MKQKIPRVVWFLGLVSLLNDTASEMLYPVLPIFLTQVLGAPAFVVGIIEGVAEGSASLFKALFGYYSDKLQKRKPFVVGGYSASAVSKILIALSYTWPLVFFARFLDRLGKGARTGARDALLLEASESNNKGLIFGIHRSMDTAGAILGPTIALVLLELFRNNIRLILLIAVIPAFLSLIFFFWVNDARKKMEVSSVHLSISLKNFSTEFKLFLLGMAIFSLGNSTDTFLILKARGLGLSLVLVISAYILYNISYAVFSTPAGSLSDKIGPKKIFLVGVLIYALVYCGFAVNTVPLLVWLLFAVYGFYIALTDGVSKAWIGSIVDPQKSASAYSVVYTVTSFFTLAASVIGGALWSALNPSTTFLFGAACAVVSLFVFSLVKFKRTES